MKIITSIVTSPISSTINGIEDPINSYPLKLFNLFYFLNKNYCYGVSIQCASDKIVFCV